MIAHHHQAPQPVSWVLDELGDFADGWDGETTRKGHKLPQNMEFNGMYDVSVFYCVFSGSFWSAFLDKTFVIIFVRTIMRVLLSRNIEHLNIMELWQTSRYGYKSKKFIDHYCHAKESFLWLDTRKTKSLKFGFKPVLDTARK
jgi:hypothetical protein